MGGTIVRLRAVKASWRRAMAPRLSAAAAAAAGGGGAGICRRTSVHPPPPPGHDDASLQVTTYLLTYLRFCVPALDTKQVTSETFFPASLLACMLLNSRDVNMVGLKGRGRGPT